MEAAKTGDAFSRRRGLKHGLTVAAFVLLLLPTIATAGPISTAIETDITRTLQRQQPVAVLPDIPLGGATAADLTDASWYAWQEFIALNWANLPVTGRLHTRETPDQKKQFGQPADPYIVLGKTAALPALVWETLRNKVEIYGGLQAPPAPPPPLVLPNGYVPTPSSDFGYDAFPQYNYGYGTSPGYGYNGSSSAAPFVNLDENSQIGTCQMFSGTPPGNNTPGSGTVTQNLVLFLAKANRVQYDYVASRDWFNTSIPAVANRAANTSGFVVINRRLPPPGAQFGSSASPGDLISFPYGTIEVKSGWRLLTPQEQKFLAATGTVPGYHWEFVRYYPFTKQVVQQGKTVTIADPTRPVDSPAVLLGLHIIHKTPSAPYFIYATFEHDSNIQDQSGQPAEDANGAPLPPSFTSTAPTPPPAGYVLQGDFKSTSPYLKNPTTSNVFTQFATAGNPQGEIFIPTETTPSAGQGAGAGNKSSYYINTHGSGLPADTSTNPILDVNRRRFLIPDPVVAVNRQTHALVAQYGFGGNQNVWLHYRLTNVQWRPVNKTPGQAYSAPINGVPPASFYQSNSMIETNIVLSGFSGQFASAPSNAITDYYYNNTTYTYQAPTGPVVSVTRQASTASAPSPFYNVYHAGQPNNMGGCMGCHGNRSVGNPNFGSTDFSFIFAGGPVANPDVARAASTPAEHQAMIAKLKKYMGTE